MQIDRMHPFEQDEKYDVPTIKSGHTAAHTFTPQSEESSVSPRNRVRSKECQRSPSFVAQNMSYEPRTPESPFSTPSKHAHKNRPQTAPPRSSQIESSPSKNRLNQTLVSDNTYRKQAQYTTVRQEDPRLQGVFDTNLPSAAYRTQPKEQCPDCNRTFALGRLEAHAKVCKRVFMEQRPVFDAAEQWRKNTPLDFDPSGHKWDLLKRPNDDRPIQKRRHATGDNTYREDMNSSPPNTAEKYKASSHLRRLVLKDGSKKAQEVQSNEQEHEDNDSVNAMHSHAGVSRGNAKPTHQQKLCPFCGKMQPSSTISGHFLRCKQLKNIRHKRAQVSSQKQSTHFRLCQHCHRQILLRDQKEHSKVCKKHSHGHS